MTAAELATGRLRWRHTAALWALAGAMAVGLARCDAQAAMARQTNPLVPGAIVCRDAETVNYAYRRYVIAVEDSIDHAMAPQLSRKPLEPDKVLLAHGCVLVPHGTPVHILRTVHGGVVEIGFHLNGAPLQGITFIGMIQQ